MDKYFSLWEIKVCGVKSLFSDGKTLFIQNHAFRLLQLSGITFYLVRFLEAVRPFTYGDSGYRDLASCSIGLFKYLSRLRTSGNNRTLLIQLEGP